MPFTDILVLKYGFAKVHQYENFLDHKISDICLLFNSIMSLHLHL